MARQTGICEIVPHFCILKQTVDTLLILTQTEESFALLGIIFQTIRIDRLHEYTDVRLSLLCLLQILVPHEENL